MALGLVGDCFPEHRAAEHKGSLRVCMRKQVQTRWSTAVGMTVHPAREGTGAEQGQEKRSLISFGVC